LEGTFIPPIEPQHTDLSPWEGMAGAAVWVNAYLVGVLSDHRPREGQAQLNVIRIDNWFDAEGRLRHHALTTLFGYDVLLNDVVSEPPEW